MLYEQMVKYDIYYIQYKDEIESFEVLMNMLGYSVEFNTEISNQPNIIVFNKTMIYFFITLYIEKVELIINNSSPNQKKFYKECRDIRINFLDGLKLVQKYVQ